jgi:homoserine kinase type II
VLEEVAARYGLEWVRLRKTVRSHTNQVQWLASPAGDLVLRKLVGRRPCHLPHIEDRHRLITCLRGRGFPVAAPLPTVDGGTVAWIGGAAHDLYPFVDGALFELGNRRQIVAAGEALAVYHGHAADFEGPTARVAWEAPERLVRPNVGPLESRCGLSDDELAYVSGRVTRLAAELERIGYEGLPRVMVHGDYRRTNLLYRGDAVVALFDLLDRSRLEPRVLDIAIALPSFTTVPERSPWPDVDLVRAFAGAYEARLALGPEERRAVPVVAEALVAGHAAEKIARAAQPPPPGEEPPSVKRLHKLVERLRRMEQSRSAWGAALERAASAARPSA